MQERILRELEDLPGIIIGEHNLNSIQYTNGTDRRFQKKTVRTIR